MLRGPPDRTDGARGWSDGTRGRGRAAALSDAPGGWERWNICASSSRCGAKLSAGAHGRRTVGGRRVGWRTRSTRSGTETTHALVFSKWRLIFPFNPDASTSQSVKKHPKRGGQKPSPDLVLTFSQFIFCRFCHFVVEKLPSRPDWRIGHANTVVSQFLGFFTVFRMAFKGGEQRC